VTIIFKIAKDFATRRLLTIMEKETPNVKKRWDSTLGKAASIS
jgi:hypothetical protein